MDELRESVARALLAEFGQQDGCRQATPETVTFDGGGLTVSYIDQSSVDFGALVSAALYAIQETHAIVPKEPTEPQLMAAYGLGSDYDIYKAMLEARPKL